MILLFPQGQLATECICSIFRGRKSNLYTKGFSYTNIKPKQIVTKEAAVEPDAAETCDPCPKCFQQKIGRGISHPCTEQEGEFGQSSPQTNRVWSRTDC